MKEPTLNKQEAFNQLPPIWPESLLAQIWEQHQSAGKRLVVLDDDPTGTQTVQDVPLLTEWSVDSLRRELEQSSVFFVLTNSRSMDTTQAEAIGEEIGKNLVRAATLAGVDFFVLSRSDSTLRGHYPAEVDALAKGLEQAYDAVIMVPYFEAGGRYTLHDIHYVQQGAELTPAAYTEFAKDKAFPFQHSYLPAYVEEKTEGRIAANQVKGISLDIIRQGGPAAVKAELLDIPSGGVVVINACAGRDLEVAVKGLQLAQAEGKRYLYRTAASFVRVLAGIPVKPLLNAQSMAIDTSNGGLMIVGSHIKKSSLQLEKVLQLNDIFPLEIEVAKLIQAETRQTIIQQYLERIEEAIGGGRHVVAYTSRKLIALGDASTSLSISRLISESICQIVERLNVQPKFLIAKGGITSNDVATKGLGVKRAMVAGQLQAGVPVWRLGPESKFPGMHYVVYPGNVGSEAGLAEAIQAFASP
ncbi:MAG: hypothetical protein KTR30_26235 [Saprospiraceae bacterium]|nr:hypothetical protein [Saprospiraceae bacterium]